MGSLPFDIMIIYQSKKLALVLSTYPHFGIIPAEYFKNMNNLK